MTGKNSLKELMRDAHLERSSRFRAPDIDGHQRTSQAHIEKFLVVHPPRWIHTSGCCDLNLSSCCRKTLDVYLTSPTFARGVSDPMPVRREVRKNLLERCFREHERF